MIGHRGTLKLIALVVMLMALLAGCVAPAAPAADAPAAEAPAADAPAAGETLTIGVSVSNFNDTFLTYMRDGMAAFAETLPDAELVVVDAKEDAAAQLSQVENFISQGVDAVVIVPVNTEATEPMTAALAEAGIPLVYVNRLPAGLPDDVVFVGSESIDAGIFQMEWIAEQIGGEGNVVIMMGKLDNEAAVKRTEGVEQVAAGFPGIAITKKDTANWSREEGLTLMENWLATGDPIAAVASNNDDMALGALEAIEAAGLLGEIIVGGVDATPDALAEMEAGRLDVTVFQDANGQGAGGIEAAYKLAKGEEVENRVWIPFQLVTQENYQEFMQ
ncbi:MAG: sugar ABC transporter substrate-binding protein [Caldilineaceae bacterium]